MVICLCLFIQKWRSNQNADNKIFFNEEVQKQLFAAKHYSEFTYRISHQFAPFFDLLCSSKNPTKRQNKLLTTALVIRFINQTRNENKFCKNVQLVGLGIYSISVSAKNEVLGSEQMSSLKIVPLFSVKKKKRCRLFRASQIGVHQTKSKKLFFAAHLIKC